MRRSWATWLAWGLWALIPLLLSVAVVMSTAWDYGTETGIGATVTFAVAFFAFGTMGALVASRVPGNALGWIFLTIGITSVTISVAASYAERGLVDAPGTLPGALAVGWVYSWLWFVIIAQIAFVPLIFPDGHLPGPRWRWIARGLVGLVVLSVIGIGISPGRLGDGTRAWPRNPLGITTIGPVVNALEPILSIAFVLLLAASLASIVVRFRRSRGDERQQLKLVGLAVVAFACLLVVPNVVGSSFSDFVFGIAATLLPVAVGVAMLKYRLYDVDRVISKTLVYGALTVVLAAVYAGLVLAGQALFASFAGGSNLAIAASTLVVAALFLPVRARIRRLVDRRFYRRRYDAQRTLEEFGARLREQIDLVSLGSELQAAVTETMQPAHVSVWRRSGAGR